MNLFGVWVSNKMNTPHLNRSIRIFISYSVMVHTIKKSSFFTFSCRHITKNCLMVFFGPRWEHFSCIQLQFDWMAPLSFYTEREKKDRLQMIVATYFVSKSSSYPSIELNIIIIKKTVRNATWLKSNICLVTFLETKK